MIHNDPSQGCIRCIDYTDGANFRANLNSGGDACECLPWEADNDIIDSSTQAITRSGSAILETQFDMTASFDTACKCNIGKYTIISNGLKCLECSADAGFVEDSELTDCKDPSDQCESKGFSSVEEDTTDPDNPTVRCGCDTSLNFADNVGPKIDTPGCWCDTNENWWTLRTDGEYKETIQHETDIEYADISQGIFRLFQLI